jgi:hypothetical protein
MPIPAERPSTGAYLGIIERIEGNPAALNPRPNDRRIWARVPFALGEDGEWTTAVRRPKDPKELDAAPNDLPETIKWWACRDGRSLGTTVSKRRSFQLYAERGTQALPLPPALVENAGFDKRFKSMMSGDRAIRPFVISTRPDACGIGRAVRRADTAVVTRLADAGVANASKLDGDKLRVVNSRGWQAGDWTLVEIDYEVNGGFGPMVVFAQGGDIRMTVRAARVVDWISADGDQIPDVILWTDRKGESAYVLVYGSFAKQVEFAW